jgi:hypothetical protein
MSKPDNDSSQFPEKILGSKSFESNLDFAVKKRPTQAGHPQTGAGRHLSSIDNLEKFAAAAPDLRDDSASTRRPHPGRRPSHLCFVEFPNCEQHNHPHRVRNGAAAQTSHLPACAPAQDPHPSMRRPQR